MQWHITERCNLRCAHCYQEGYGGEELDFDALLAILGQFHELLSALKGVGSRVPVCGQVTVTGGEPFVRPDFLELLEVFHKNRRYYRYAILTNGSLIDEAMARRLARLSPAFVQVSIEGNQETHDRIRGSGSFERTVGAIRLLVKSGIRAMISFTAHRGNYREFKEVAELGVRLRVHKVWADRLIPRGTGESLKEQVLSPAETREFFEIMRCAREAAERRWFCRTEIAMDRALQFLEGGRQIYHCTAGDSLITVQANGDLVPCRRMPIPVGNLLESSLVDLYERSALFRALRDKRRMSEGCRSCVHAMTCRGGLRCLSYAVNGDPFTCDPGCWLSADRTRISASRLPQVHTGSNAGMGGMVSTKK